MGVSSQGDGFVAAASGGGAEDAVEIGFKPDHDVNVHPPLPCPR